MRPTTTPWPWSRGQRAWLAGSIAAGFALFGVLMPVTLAGSGVFMSLLARG
jgi:hypothetical protein